ncbi:PP2C family protein-serine/threonine phosphatase [Lentzea albidocapillata]|uniref:Stage II sporulation protein E (SpoIIE) n=1 Tax=Lentzea albidocapillata TaxID=40571 RepID=A0A1W1ZZ09_9PSEU|nr:PP2C family protein-serine/threonine phosphatase [Lentzea albidocapillata]SMC53596.1 Stage II sporulation protein E (SpoIIE) [Lentzea albidocapillata]
MNHDLQLRALSLAFSRAGLTPEQLWTRYFALGGAAGPMEVEAYLHGLMPLPALQRDMLAHAINERFDELNWPHRVPYTFPARGSGLLDGMRKAPPERLRAAAALAGRAPGVRIAIYLVGYDQQTLHPLHDPEAGMLEPCHEAGGDAFDCTLSPTAASLAIFDAVGHTPSSGFVAAAALAACRSDRRVGHGLVDQARAIDETISRQFPGGAFATGVLAELDLGSGRLRYLNAGHPPPLLLRCGKVVGRLTGGRRPPFGLGTGELVIAEETLQPGDWLVLHTDGITEARDDAGEFFGQTRLTDFLEREAAARRPPPETARRLIKAVLAHQNGALRDDASILLARWTKSDEPEL